MTENEAIRDLQYLIGEYSAYPPETGVNATVGSLQYCITALKEIQQYREIGTVEECRKAVDKTKPKAPKDELKINPVIDENGAYVDADTTVYILCPNCGELVGMDEDIDRFCRECGQAILREGEDD